jgi:hypothetical protein
MSFLLEESPRGAEHRMCRAKLSCLFEDDALTTSQNVATEVVCCDFAARSRARGVAVLGTGCDHDCVGWSSGSIGQLVVLGSALLVACGGNVFSAGSQGGTDGGEDAPFDVTGGESAGDDGPSPGPDAATDAPAHADASARDSATQDAKIVDAVPPRDVVTGGGGCDAATTVALRVFVTAHQFSAALGGLAGADTLCQTAATNAGLKGTFVAWLSDDQTSAKSRICDTTASFVLVDGTPVAIGVAGLTSNQLLHAIDVTEMGVAAPTMPTACGDTQLAVWTGTEYTGAGQPGYNCQNWTSSSSSADGVVGFAQATNGSWTYGCSGTTICNLTASLYCIEQ